MVNGAETFFFRMHPCFWNFIFLIFDGDPVKCTVGSLQLNLNWSYYEHVSYYLTRY